MESKEAKPPRNKTKTFLKSLSKEKTDELGIEVERLIKKEMAYIVNFYMSSYTTGAKETLGWDREDLMQHIKVILWTALATFKPEKGFKVTTYLSSNLYYQMGNLSKKIQSKKNSQTKLFFPEEIFETGDNVEEFFGEDWYAYITKFKSIADRLNDVEKKVLVSHLVFGEEIEEISEKYSIDRVIIVKALKEIKRIAEYEQ